ncbi:hypothetical protein P153DRAFT_174101 [Dothidotthia symphoricarpi CBS 119687]|uniref:Uncharacterized protein n=1 Tax=Dothidotthia symphoricarpi CBS 119687 TaxID=1392245 RepID=A0A6A6AQM2_9PLEO|nr:uncharacterized protein P153DRAFT_174101 [Dothidotthia symphoricarpi CBS 119687]KAF2132811.1 hypothetical protein P153DRAFT_174101 [Dothidotthia symphoricarpi CBS 119687]
MASVAPPRRFRVEPIETSARSSKEQYQTQQPEKSEPARKFAPEPIETTSRTSRRFAPEPIETTQKTNRRFAPEPVETTTRSSRQKFCKEWEDQISPRRLKPEPVETMSYSSRRSKDARIQPTRRFMPQLVETAQRSRRTGDAVPTISTSDKTEATPNGCVSARESRILGILPTVPHNTPTLDLSCNPLFLEIQRAASPLTRRRSYFSSSQHSFRVPDLDPIESSGSEASGPPSPTTSPSAKCDNSFRFKGITPRQESEDERASGHLLELAAKAAERQLREQAMAAFPNNDYHERIDHYIDRDSEEPIPYPDEAMSRRESSFSETNWELEAMRKYQEKQKEDKEKQARQESLSKEHSMQTKTASKLAGKPVGLWAAKKIAGEKMNPEMERMRKGARPPMLGKNIKFPRCSSPEPSRFDPTQGCDIVRTTMCYLSEQSRAAEEKGESLWCGKGNGKQTSKTPSLWSSGSRTSSTHGLWGGFCLNGGDKSPRGPTGILTPSHEKANPFSPCPTPAMSLLPPTPPTSAADFSSIDEKLAIEQTIIEDFGDDFVTQVYNYLSLGYPSMARPFDEELSKISKIPVSELRQDDHLAASRGYIRLGKDGNLADSEITEETCVRWRALRLYIQEWGRQHPGMADEEQGRGTAVRKGSWAV